MAKITDSLTGTGASTEILESQGSNKGEHGLGYDVSGTFVGTVVFERSLDGGTVYTTIVSKTAAATGDVVPVTGAKYRFNCTAYTSGTIVVKAML